MPEPGFWCLSFRPSLIAVYQDLSVISDGGQSVLDDGCCDVRLLRLPGHVLLFKMPTLGRRWRERVSKIRRL